MTKIVEEFFYDGAREKMDRLGLAPLLDEIRSALQSFSLLVLEQKNKNSGGVLRQMIDMAFVSARGWENTVSGGIDWVKCKTVNGTKVCIGVEVQVSARSDLITRDVVHLQKQFREGAIDLGIIILPSDDLSYFLTDRAPAASDGKRIIHEMRADDLPLVILAIQHDGPAKKALPKMKTKH
ncbi:MAG: hypothetical protein WBN92_07460 [Terriglobia bacterium]